MLILKERFIILRKMKYGEADLIIHALSPVGEKKSFIARAALKSKKRFGGGVLDPSHFVSFTYRQAKEDGGLNTLQEASLINDFPGIRTTYEKLELALHIIECVTRVSQEGDIHSEFLFNLTGHALKAVEVCQDPQVLRMHFYLKLLWQQGVMTAEPWMGPFLKTNLSDTNLLLAQKPVVSQYLNQTENNVQNYIRSADLGQF